MALWKLIEANHPSLFRGRTMIELDVCQIREPEDGRETLDNDSSRLKRMYESALTDQTREGKGKLPQVSADVEGDHSRPQRFYIEDVLGANDFVESGAATHHSGYGGRDAIETWNPV